MDGCRWSRQLTRCLRWCNLDSNVGARLRRRASRNGRGAAIRACAERRQVASRFCAGQRVLYGTVSYIEMSRAEPRDNRTSSLLQVSLMCFGSSLSVSRYMSKVADYVDLGPFPSQGLLLPPCRTHRILNWSYIPGKTNTPYSPRVTIHYYQIGPEGRCGLLYFHRQKKVRKFIIRKSPTDGANR